MFFGKTGTNMGHRPMLVIQKLCFSNRYFNEVLCASNGDRRPKLQPQEVDVPIYPNKAHCLALHLLGLGF